MIPTKIINNFDVVLLSAALTKKAGEIFNIATPNYSFNKCKTDKDCSTDEACVESGASNQGGNKCVKECGTHEECGKRYSCRGRCVHGENGCPKTFVNICMPDLPSAVLDKTGKAW